MKKSMLVKMAPVAFVAVVALGLAAAGPGTADRSIEQQAIEEAIQFYFDGIMKYDVEALERAFHADAYLFASLPGRNYRAPFQQWKRFTERGDPPDPEGYVNRIVSVDISGNAAVVKTDLDWPNIHYIDYLSLVKVDGQWKIVNKIWHQERK